MDDQQLQQATRLWVQQKITLMINRYTVSIALPDGSVGEQIAFVEQKRMTLKEQVTFEKRCWSCVPCVMSTMITTTETRARMIPYSTMAWPTGRCRPVRSLPARFPNLHVTS